jgi:hypothetical protein
MPKAILSIEVTKNTFTLFKINFFCATHEIYHFKKVASLLYFYLMFTKINGGKLLRHLSKAASRVFAFFQTI